jgi:hypothetical protein
MGWQKNFIRKLNLQVVPSSFVITQKFKRIYQKPIKFGQSSMWAQKNRKTQNNSVK